MVGPFIFLDIDGVLNHHVTHRNGYSGLCPDCVKLLNRTLDVTGAKIVVSSAWRYFVLRGEMNLAGLSGLLCTHGVNWGVVADILGSDIADGCGSVDRGKAIKRWFTGRYGLAHQVNYAILDDMDLGYDFGHFWPTIPNKGLCGFSDSIFEDIHAALGYRNHDTLPHKSSGV